MARLAPFTKSFTQQEPLPPAAIEAAVAVMQSGALHRYGANPSRAAELERAYAQWLPATFCLATASGGQAMQIALRALGVKPGDKVLTNAWTLAPVPGAIACVGGEAVLVETTDDLVIDLTDLEQKIRHSDAKILLLSHMRGHLADMNTLMAIADAHGVNVVEDCAHTMGAAWNGKRSGTFGEIGCFSTQTYKHINSGEGGFLTTSDPVIAARATVLSGSYMLWSRHGAGPGPESYVDAALDMPNGSARMDELRAAILLPQIATLDENCDRWIERHSLVRAGLLGVDGVALPAEPDGARRVGSSIQFRLPSLSEDGCRAFIDECAAVGVEVKWFGSAQPMGFTSAHSSWRYRGRVDTLPNTDRVLATLFDMRVPLTFSLDDCRQLGALLAECAQVVLNR
ncbi:DegT/DnrJ/EryC1/StrS family aminotransferase [Pontivivens insulae]|uniref:dTDP-3-amino-3,6-dideoxy-alpha-D-galactopyranose transaminase n=1 Tax=Pontivivens insulae TaxID=1639689 RepID=A0A2R8AEZ7_9RHOB|nr:aminotransferase class I/II-fold pyridoxal phosphate-dependent enzyme [Pontivivens insulae]RED11863.1 dTDP-4-amino-4,6-dideoxygalactose transaminase [Pontivivens insulae]SPF30620.1 dTDP-3-amino-3,6-dideoxy-alpha-D-galactopyranose transaminase [Pontivivens insulae]